MSLLATVLAVSFFGGLALILLVVAFHRPRRQCAVTVTYNAGTPDQQESRCVLEHNHTAPMHFDGKLYWRPTERDAQ